MFDITQKRMTYDNVLIKIVDVQQDNSVFVDVKQYGDKPEIGEVIAVGPGRVTDNGHTVPCVVNIGDIVMFNKYSATKYRNSSDRIDYYVVREEDIIAY